MSTGFNVLRQSRSGGRLLALSLSALAVACSGSQNDRGEKAGQGANQQVPKSARGSLSIPAGAIPVASGSAYRLPGGELVATQLIGGETYVRVAGALSDPAYRALQAEAASRRLSDKDRTDLMGATVQSSVKTIQSHAALTGVSIRPSVGYFSGWLRLADFSALQNIGELPAGMLLNPVVLDESKLPDLAKNLEEELVDGRLDTAGFSGLKRIGVPEFLKQVEADTGSVPDGSTVLSGVTDTGITLNHPSFMDADGNSRIVYMKEFTGEGTAYFSPLAGFEVKIPQPADIPEGVEPDQALLLSADYMPGSIGLGTRPAADAFQTLKDKLILVSPELKTILTNPASGARLGLLSESAFQSASESADINQNGKTDDPIWIILVPGANPTEHKLFVDLSATGDFRTAQVVTDWNTSRSTVSAFAETFGFDVSATELVTGEGDTISAIRAGIVGFDPGNHGSHVAGIISGRKTLANDEDDTLARGVAPATRIAMNRVCANNGGCNATEAFIDLAENGADLINMSLGGLSAFNDGFDVQALMINRLSQLHNTLFVISAGNSGPGRNTVGSPSVARLSLSVGATASREMIERQYQWPGFGKDSEPEITSPDFMLFFSSRGPTAAGGFKPSISAPGTELSAVQLNAAIGARSGLDVYWGTSMAAPTASGAYALLLDAVRKHNAKSPDSPLPEDSMTLRRVLMESARPFDVKKFDPATGEHTDGQYTWIDQGAGMINLPAAWDLLKKMKAKSGTTFDYEVRVLRKNPNGLAYDGTLPALTPIGTDPNQTTTIPRFGTGIWLDQNANDSLIEVQLARRVTEDLMATPKAGEYHRELVTTSEEFELVTEVYGSRVKWLEAGTLNSLDCKDTKVNPSVTIIGAGALDVPGADASQPGTSQGFRPGNLYVCADRQAMKALPPGDHGALIKAYKKVKGQRELVPSFIVPVYVTVPHQKLENEQSFAASGIVKSFQVSRNYVEIPEGTTLVKVNVTVPEAKEKNGDLVGCSGVALYVLESGNTIQPPEFAADRNNSIARSCTDDGAPVSDLDTRSITFERTNPNPGIWDLHIFGRYNFASSAFDMRVDYATLASGIEQISGSIEALNGSFDLAVKSASFKVEPDVSKSTYLLTGLANELTSTVKDQEFLKVPDASGATYRSYPASVRSVVIDTYGAPTSDIDLQILECTAKDDESTCALVASSGTATDVEQAAFVPSVDKFYVAVVHGYEVAEGSTAFKLKESRFVTDASVGSVAIDTQNETQFAVTYALDTASATLLQDPLFLSGAYRVIGSLSIRSTSDTLLTEIPVSIEHSAQPARPAE